MKNSIKSIFVIALFILSVGNLQAQKKIKVTEVEQKINDFKGTALQIKINRSSEKEISKAWKKKMKGYNGSVKTKKNEIRATEVVVPAISKFPIQVFAAVEDNKKENNQTFSVIFLNGNTPISKSNDVSGYTAAKSMLEEFGNTLSKEGAKAFKEAQADVLDDYKDEVKDLDKETKKANKEIENKKDEIKDLEKMISQNKKKKEELSKKIKEQEAKVKDAKKEEGLYK